MGTRMIDEIRNEERVLRRAVLRGDEAAWRVFFERYFDVIYAYALHKCRGDQPLAEDIAQEAWAVAVRRIRAFDPDRGRFGTWMRGIVDKLYIGYVRREARRAKLVDEHSFRPDDTTQPEAHAEGEHVALAYAELPPRYTAVIRAKYESQLSVNEIAEAWGESPKAVESLLSRARRAFREAYGRLAEN